MLKPGNPIPSLSARSIGNPGFSLDSLAGRHVVLSFLCSSRIPGVEAFYARLRAEEQLFDDRFASMVIVSNDLQDEQSGKFADRAPGIKVLWDEQGHLARTFGCLRSGKDTGRIALMTWILDPGLRVVKVLPIDNLETHLDTIRAALDALRDPADAEPGWAPVLQVPDLIEPDLCRALIAYSETQTFTDSAFMTRDPSSGRNVAVVNPLHMRRMDCGIADADLRAELQARVNARIVPLIEEAFRFRATRMERYLLTRYDAEQGSFCHPHRDTGSIATAHRRFAVSINLNADDYEGGDLRFPAFGPRTYRAPTGGALIFSSALLREMLPVTRGRRIAIEPFLYDETAAAERVENARILQAEEMRRSLAAQSANEGDARSAGKATSRRKAAASPTRKKRVTAAASEIPAKKSTGRKKAAKAS